MNAKMCKLSRWFNFMGRHLAFTFSKGRNLYLCSRHSHKILDSKPSVSKNKVIWDRVIQSPTVLSNLFITNSPTPSLWNEWNISLRCNWNEVLDVFIVRPGYSTNIWTWWFLNKCLKTINNQDTWFHGFCKKKKKWAGKLVFMLLWSGQNTKWLTL